jgi:hypothetical protein
MKKILYLFLSMLPSVFYAQGGGINNSFVVPKNERRYYTQQNHQRLLSLDKDLARRRAFLELSIRDLALNDLPKDVTIPVVVHILYKSGTDTRTLPTTTEIKIQLDDVGKDFRQTVKIEKHAADTKEKFSNANALDTRISFCLASKDPFGNPTTGIVTVPTAVTTWLGDDKMKSATTGGSTAWDTEKYVNIWVVSFPDTISGYAQMPAGPPATDGIVLDTRYFGKKNLKADVFPYNEGKTLTHLIAGYLNVYELWSETVACGDDGVDDTPIHNLPNLGWGCADYRHVSACNGEPVEMTMNFMDNTNDACVYMFTNGQKKRLQASLVKEGIRYKLTQSGDTQCNNGGNLQAAQVRQADNLLQTLPVFTYRIYPNPAQDNLNIEIATDKATEAEFTIFNLQGSIQKQVNYNVKKGNQEFTVRCNDWLPGVYLVRMEVDGTAQTEKVIINR